jgi:hypothetical protein
MADCKVFYSWQSDLPNSTNRSFIETALQKATKSIYNDDSIEVDPVIDRDTANVPGSPDIATTIFEKIDNAVIFVCDISIINPNSQSRLTPNPNVLIELGYAINALGSERIIMVMNTAFGKPEELPFDLRMKRVVTYNANPEDNDRSQERQKLQSILKEAMNTIFRMEMSQTNDNFLCLLQEAIDTFAYAWQVERDGRGSVKDAKIYLAKSVLAISPMVAINQQYLSPSDRDTINNCLMRMQALTDHMLFLDGGKSKREFWETGDLIISSLPSIFLLDCKNTR